MSEMGKIKLAVVCSFGLEAVVKRELIKMGYENLFVDNGWIYFEADVADIAKTNINLRSAERVLLVMGSFQSETFEELYDQTYSLPWEDWIEKDGRFTVNGKSYKSKLFSVPDCQSIVKKAIVDKLKQKYQQEWFNEKGAEFTVQVSIHKDRAVLTLDTTGAREGLFKRGYRKDSVLAPIKETMAAALVELSFWNKDRVLVDPMCGSGTIPIEAAMIGTCTAPGLYRHFASEDWKVISDSVWQDTRDYYESLVDEKVNLQIYASDISEQAIKAARSNAKRAGMDQYITFKVLDVKDYVLPEKHGVMITNPPYGDRLGDQDIVIELAKTIGNTFGSDPTWSNYVITSFEAFEKAYGQKASKKRKLFNGDVKVNYYQFFGEKK
jgi:putative N6-adenine-specific DNA methylase